MGEILIKTKTGFYLWRNPLDKSQEILGATVPMINHNGVDVREHKLSLKNCQAIERGYDLDELAENYAKFMNDDDGTSDIDFKVGFQKALEIIGDKKFSEEDIIKIAEYVRVASQSTPNVRTKELFNEYQSLQQTEWEVEIDMEMYDDPDFVLNLDREMRLTPKILYRPKLDSNGCLILKLKK